MCTPKNLLSFINLIFFVSALGLIVLGTLTQNSLYGNYGLFGGYVNKLALLSIGFGVLLAFTSLFALFGVCCRSRSLLSGHTCIVLVLIVIEMSVCVAGFALESRVLDLIENTMRSAEARYNKNNFVTYFWNSIQRELKCCGVDNYTDWFHFLGNSTLPDSCCVIQTLSCGSDVILTGNFYQTACSSAITKWAHEHELPAAILFPIVIFFQILSVLWSKWYQRDI